MICILVIKCIVNYSFIHNLRALHNLIVIFIVTVTSSLSFADDNFIFITSS